MDASWGKVSVVIDGGGERNMEFLDPIMGYFNQALAFFMPGLLAHAGDGAAVNWMALGIQLGVIALVLALLMREIGGIIIFTVVGVIIHVIVDVVMPMVRGGGGEGFDINAFISQFTRMVTCCIWALWRSATLSGLSCFPSSRA